MVQNYPDEHAMLSCIAEPLSAGVCGVSCVWCVPLKLCDNAPTPTHAKTRSQTRRLNGLQI